MLWDLREEMNQFGGGAESMLVVGFERSSNKQCTNWNKNCNQQQLHKQRTEENQQQQSTTIAIGDEGKLKQRNMREWKKRGERMTIMGEEGKKVFLIIKIQFFKNFEIKVE